MGWNNEPQNYKSYANLTSDVTTTSLTLVDITGLSFEIGPSEVWFFMALLRTGSSSVQGIKLAVNVPGTSTFTAFANGNTTAVTVYTTDIMNTDDTAGISFNSYNGQTGLVQINGVVTADSTGGTVQLRFQKQNSGTATIGTGSHLIAWRKS